MYDAGGILTHGRLDENIDYKASKNLKLPDPRELKAARAGSRGGESASTASATRGGYSAIRGFPQALMRPPAIKPGETVTFTNHDALSAMPDEEQAWHSDHLLPGSLQQGLGDRLSAGPRADRVRLRPARLRHRHQHRGDHRLERLTTPPLTKPGKTYTYFCRIHPFMRGSIRVRERRKHS